MRELSEYAKMRLEALIKELSKMSADDAKTVINARAKDFLKDPTQLIALFNATETNPNLKSAIAKTDLAKIEFLEKFYKKNEAVLRATSKPLIGKESDHLRELKNVVTHLSRSALTEKDAHYPLNPLPYEKTLKSKSVSALINLIDYLVGNPESAFHFLRIPEFKAQLAKNPILIARMIASDDNLRKTLTKEEITHLEGLLEKEKDSLDKFLETVELLHTNEMSGNTQKVKLMKEISSIAKLGELPKDEVKDTSKKKVGSSVKLAELPIDTIKTLNEDTKTAFFTNIEDMLKTLPETDKKVSFQRDLDNIKRAQTSPQGNAFYNIEVAGFRLHKEVTEAKKQHEAWKQVQSWLNDDTLKESVQFNKTIRLELEKLLSNPNATTEELTKNEHEINEIQKKTRVFLEIKKLMEELRNLEPEAAKEFEKRYQEYTEKFNSPTMTADTDTVYVKGEEKNVPRVQQKGLDEFARDLKKEIKGIAPFRTTAADIPEEQHLENLEHLNFLKQEYKSEIKRTHTTGTDEGFLEFLKSKEAKELKSVIGSNDPVRKLFMAEMEQAKKEGHNAYEKGSATEDARTAYEQKMLEAELLADAKQRALEEKQEQAKKARSEAPQPGEKLKWRQTTHRLASTPPGTSPSHTPGSTPPYTPIMGRALKLGRKDTARLTQSENTAAGKQESQESSAQPSLNRTASTPAPSRRK